MSFKRLDPEDISISAESVTAPAWSGQVSTLATFFTSSQVTLSSGLYYYNVFQTQSTATGAETQFSIAYGNINGSGSVLFTPGEVGKSPSSVIYGQYRTLVNGDENTNFTFGTIVPDSIYAITVNRSRFKEKLLPGSFGLTLTSGSRTISLIDNSSDITTVSYVDAGRVYDIVSGSGTTVYKGVTTTGFTPASGSYGKFLPDVGVILLNGDALRDTTYGIRLNVSQSYNAAGGNLDAFFNSIKAGANFTLRSEETISSNYVFVRVRNSEFNYSTNPSNITGSGDLLHSIMVNSPQAYMTTVGLYNDNNDLLGVAKLSRPLLKDFTKEALVRIKLDY
jgi:hypothetical protein